MMSLAHAPKPCARWFGRLMLAAVSVAPGLVAMDRPERAFGSAAPAAEMPGEDLLGAARADLLARFPHLRHFVVFTEDPARLNLSSQECLELVVWAEAHPYSRPFVPRAPLKQVRTLAQIRLGLDPDRDHAPTATDPGTATPGAPGRSQWILDRLGAIAMGQPVPEQPVAAEADADLQKEGSASVREAP